MVIGHHQRLSRIAKRLGNRTRPPASLGVCLWAAKIKKTVRHYVFWNKHLQGGPQKQTTIPNYHKNQLNSIEACQLDQIFGQIKASKEHYNTISRN